jgi:hypothetical protein
VAFGLIAALALATIAVIALTPGPVPARVLASTWTACAALAAARRVPAGRKGKGARTFVLRLPGEVAVQQADGRWTHGTLRDGSFVAPWLTIVRWRPEAARCDRTVLILPGMTAPRTFRRLRVLLRWA